MLLFVAVCGITILAYVWWRDRSPISPTALRWIAANTCIATFAIPVLIGMTSPTQFRQLAWIPSLNLHDVGAVVSNTIVGTLTPGHFPGGIAAAAVACVLAVAVLRELPAPRVTAIALAIPGLYVALVILVSVTLQPIFLSRIFCWIGIPLCLIGAHAVTSRGWLRPVAIVTIAGATFIGLSYQLDANPAAKEPWHDAIQSSEALLKQAELVVLGPNTDPAPVMYYAPALSRVAMWTAEPTPAAALGIMPRLFGVPGITRDEIARAIDASTSGVVIIARAPDKPLIPELLQRVRPPVSRVDRPCVGGDARPTSYPCGVAILAWAPEQGGAEEDKTARPENVETRSAPPTDSDFAGAAR
jgi:hypothetical protein